MKDAENQQQDENLLSQFPADEKEASVSEGPMPSLTATSSLDYLLGRVILKTRTIRAQDGKGWSEVEFFIDGGRRVKILPAGKDESLSLVLWISGATWWKPWTWFRGYWKGVHPGDFAYTLKPASGRP